MKIKPIKPAAILIFTILTNGCALVPEYDTPVSEKHVEQKEKVQKEINQLHEPKPPRDPQQTPSP